MNNIENQIKAIANSIKKILCKEICAHDCSDVTLCDEIMQASKTLYDDDIRKIDNDSRDDWNRVEDRLPTDNQDVLCWYEYFRYGSYNRMYQTYGIGHYNSTHNFWGGVVSNGVKSRVIAWMPLPPPPTKK